MTVSTTERPKGIFLSSPKAIEAAQRLEEMFAKCDGDGDAGRIVDDLKLILPTMRALVRLEQDNNQRLKNIEAYLEAKFGTIPQAPPLS